MENTILGAKFSVGNGIIHTVVGCGADGKIQTRTPGNKSTYLWDAEIVFSVLSNKSYVNMPL